jgi:hypothetical protein
MIDMSVPRVTSVATLLALVPLGVGCSTRSGTPSTSSDPRQVTHQIMAAYQAADDAQLKALTSTDLPLRSGDLGRVTDVRWLPGPPDHAALPSGFVGPVDCFSFNATTTGSPDGAIPSGPGWAWGFCVSRHTDTSPWLLVDQGIG